MHGSPYAQMTPRDVRQACREGRFTGPTAGVARGFAQANLVALPAILADDFTAFCQANPRPCPLLESTAPGQYAPQWTATDADLRTDLPRYRVLVRGECTANPTDLLSHWTDDLVAFLIGCSFTFESALLEAGIPVRHIEQRCNVPMYRTNLACQPVGPFRGSLVVSMRPMTPEMADAAARVTASYTRVHGAPVHVGDPGSIGITDLARPDYGDAVQVRAGETPVFWACGVTPLEAILQTKPELAIVHEPGHMFVTDLLDTDLRDDSSDDA